MADVDIMKFYLGVTPGGVEGDRAFRSNLRTGILETTDENVARDHLSDEEINEYLAYSGWNLWDMIAGRSTEGESGLIPRQEYETVSFVQQWLKFPRLFRQITETVGGAEGVVALGGQARTVGTKLNLLHVWANSCTLLGRGILVKLGLEKVDERRDDLETTIQFMRRIQHGAYGGGPCFASARQYHVPILEPDVVQRLTAGVEAFAPDDLDAFRSFNATTELFGFLLHWDCRAALNDTGPYDLGDGGFMIIRDHFLNEATFPWAGVAGELPYCVTQAMVFQPDEPIDVRINDIATTFSEPRNYLKHLRAAAVFARDTPTTPMSELRPVEPAERAEILARCQTGIGELYGTIAGMDRQDLIMAGVRVYTTDMMRPYAEPVGLWDRFLHDQKFLELHPIAQEAYGPLESGEAMKVLPPVFVLGEGYPPC
jgi:hypothetical protein